MLYVLEVRKTDETRKLFGPFVSLAQARKAEAAYWAANPSADPTNDTLSTAIVEIQDCTGFNAALAEAVYWSIRAATIPVRNRRSTSHLNAETLRVLTGQNWRVGPAGKALYTVYLDATEYQEWRKTWLEE